MAATVRDASSGRADIVLRGPTPQPVEIERLLSGVVDSPTRSSGWRVIRSWPTYGTGTRPALTIAHDSSSMLRNAQVTRSVAPWVDYVSERLRAIEEDPEPGLPPVEVINRARSWIMHVLPPAAPSPAVLPSEDGGIDFVWHRAGWNVEIGIERDGTETVWMWHRDSNDEVFGDLTEHREVVADLIRSLSQHG